METNEQPGGDSRPGVSYVMPALNDADYIESAVRSILAQDYPGPTEIIVAVGPSSDDTLGVVTRLQKTEPTLRTVLNPVGDVTVGLNLAMRASSHPVVVRVDAHTELPDGYTRSAVETLLRTGAVNVGGIMVAEGRPGMQAAIAAGYNSRLGLGGGAYHLADASAGPSESAYLGVMWRDAILDVGGFDESLRRGEDWELNHRLRRAGGLVWLDPALRVTYWPRRTLSALWRQFYATGVWRGELVRRLRLHNSPRYFAPPTLVVLAGSAVVLSPLIGLGGPWPTAALVAAAGPVTHLALVAGYAATRGGTVADRARSATVLVVMHYAWGAGFLIGILRGAAGTVDTSRIRSGSAAVG